MPYHFTNRNRNNSSGFSLLELLLVTGMGALLLLAGIASYSLLASDSNIEKSLKLLAVTKQQTQRAYQGQRTYGIGSANLIPVLAAMKTFPSGVVDKTGTPRHPWEGKILVKGAGQKFNITFAEVPSEACIELGNAFNQTDADFVSLKAGDIVFDDENPVSRDALASTDACGAGKKVDMVWSFF
jgi:type II secretory pathway pseudopilin PulG